MPARDIALRPRRANAPACVSAWRQIRAIAHGQVTGDDARRHAVHAAKAAIAKLDELAAARDTHDAEPAEDAT